LSHRISNSAHITCREGEPRALCREWSASHPEGEALLLVEFDLAVWWEESAPPVSLTAIYCIKDGQLSCAVTNQLLQRDEAASAQAQYDRWLAEHSLLSVTPGQLLPLAPTYIPKPWGQEIWFTGVEARGICCFGDGGARVPIPWLQAVMPDDSLGACGEPLVLLKVLDPVSREVTGDLYFELHEEKREVYVVTHVDCNAWPDGIGYIRFGFSPSAVAAAGSEAAFRAAYLDAVKTYEQIRREIDAAPEAAGPDLIRREARLRREMEAYTHLHPLQVGDVVAVPLLMPHSLQHGVRTIEFQTPVYERKILSFAQKVLTQGHWDTGEAVEQMRLFPPEQQPFELLVEAGGVRVERIVDFPDFEVRRIHIAADSAFDISVGETYGLVMLVQGQLSLEGRRFRSEQAFLIPGNQSLTLSPPEGVQTLVLLLALPRC